ncbi:type II secretion system major pseudopilin GspG [Cedecea sp.]|jgi:general secretion pathway protein G|uniref:type II secretion system major pseudopilin GspG n=1 Tax=Cedecea sp. TaxID=1970739 RepID=UPI002F40F9C4
MQHTTRQRGFTLLEIMVVIVILGILASLTIPSLMSNKDRADRQKAISDIVTLENALDMYRLDNGRYPTTEQGVSALVSKPQLAPVPAHYRTDGYVRRLPQDPWGNDYRIISPGLQGTIDVFSSGPDGEAGTDDDIGNWTLEGNVR